MIIEVIDSTSKVKALISIYRNDAKFPKKTKKKNKISLIKMPKQKKYFFIMNSKILTNIFLFFYLYIKLNHKIT
jgi:hypothetical protein